MLKIEINHSNRAHILKTKVMDSIKTLGETASINVLATEELIGSKISALIIRTTPRDVYDVYNLFNNDNNNYIVNKDLIKKIAIFYICLQSDIPINFEEILDKALAKITNLNYQRIKKKH